MTHESALLGIGVRQIAFAVLAMQSRYLQPMFNRNFKSTAQARKCGPFNYNLNSKRADSTAACPASRCRARALVVASSGTTHRLDPPGYALRGLVFGLNGLYS